VQLNQNQPRRLYEGADLTYYVISGEGTLRVAFASGGDTLARGLERLRTGLSSL